MRIITLVWLTGNTFFLNIRAPARPTGQRNVLSDPGYANHLHLCEESVNTALTTQW